MNVLIYTLNVGSTLNVQFENSEFGLVDVRRVIVVDYSCFFKIETVEIQVHQIFLYQNKTPSI